MYAIGKPKIATVFPQFKQLNKHFKQFLNENFKILFSDYGR